MEDRSIASEDFPNDRENRSLCMEDRSIASEDFPNDREDCPNGLEIFADDVGHGGNVIRL